MAWQLMTDFTKLQQHNKKDLDKRAMGLSPALLQEICLQEHTLKGVFRLLSEHMQKQILEWNTKCRHGTLREDKCNRCGDPQAPQPGDAVAAGVGAAGTAAATTVNAAAPIMEGEHFLPAPADENDDRPRRFQTAVELLDPPASPRRFQTAVEFLDPPASVVAAAGTSPAANKHRNGEEKLDKASYSSIELIAKFDWRLHEIRSALMLVVDNKQKSNAEVEWPQVGWGPYTDQQRTPHTEAVTAMLEDEKKLNKALTTVKRDFTSEEPLLVEKMFMESALHQKIKEWRKIAGDQTPASLRFVLQAVMNKDYKDSETHKYERGKKEPCAAGLAGVWHTAVETNDPHLLLVLGNSALPPSYTAVYGLPEPQ